MLHCYTCINLTDSDEPLRQADEARGLLQRLRPARPRVPPLRSLRGPLHTLHVAYQTISGHHGS